MTAEFKLELEKRSESGKRPSEELRRQGQIPGIFYSAKHAATPFSIDRRHLHDALHSQSHVYAVSVGKEKLHAIFKEIQYHPVTDEITHVDLFGVSLEDKITLSVPVVLEGDSAGVQAGGILTQNITELEIECLATKVPDAVHIDVEPLEIGSAVHVSDLSVEDVEILTNPEITVVSVQAPKEEIIEEVVLEEVEELEGEEVTPEGEAEEGEEAAEGEAAEGEAKSE